MKLLFLFLFLIPTLVYSQTEAGPQCANLTKYQPSWQPSPVLRDSLRKAYKIERRQDKSRTRLWRIARTIFIISGIFVIAGLSMFIYGNYTAGGRRSGDLAGYGLLSLIYGGFGLFVAFILNMIWRIKGKP